MSVAHWVTLFQAWSVSASATNWQLFLLMQNFAMETVNSNNSMLANDPDADYLIGNSWETGRGEWKVFNRKEIRAMLGWWTLDSRIRQMAAKAEHFDSI